jgi:uroporphyrin-III C-methyltransferase
MGKVFLVGAGPGDPDLITLKGLKCIRRADVILYDRLVNGELLEEARPGADLIYCGKRPGSAAMKQETIHHFLIKFAAEGKTVTRLKGGDPFIFGRGGEEASALRAHGIAFEVVPGITAGAAAPAYAGIPITHRDFGSSVTFVTGHRRRDGTDDIRWENLAKGSDTLAVYMGVRSLPRICGELIKHGRPGSTPVAVVQWGTTAGQKAATGTLTDIAEKSRSAGIGNPAMIVIGEVVRLRESLRWFDADRADGEAEADGGVAAAEVEVR